MSKHPINRLTPLSVSRAKPGLHCDGGGLYLRVDPSGAKRWEVRLTIQGTRHTIGLGSVRDESLADARIEAARLRRIAKKGGNPLAEKQHERKAGVTFEKIARQVHERESESFRNPKHKAQWLDSLVTYVFPTIGSIAIDAIESGDVLAILSPLWTTKHETASRLRQRLRRVFEYAEAKNLIERNPVDRIRRALPKVKRQPKHHDALPYRQVPQFLLSLKAARTVPSVRLALEFLVLTATRTTETLGAKWSEIDGHTWIVPGERTKSGREHRVPLSPQAREVLELAATIRTNDYIFPGKRGPLSQQAMLMCVKRMNYDCVPHGFRSSFRDWGAERTTFARDVLEAALAHVVKDKTEAAYFRSTLFEQRRALMNTWGVFCTTRQADVVTLNAG